MFQQRCVRFRPPKGQWRVSVGDQGHLGLVSNDLHRRYTVRCDVLSVVCSGFFDSIGVYDVASEMQIRIAKDWLVAVDMADKASAMFQSLSYGEQRLVLIARAYESPLLLA